MRGIETPIKTLRQKVFTEVAKVAFDSQNINDDIEAIPYKITPGDAPLYRESIYRERAICSERVRLAMGLSLRPDDEPVHVTSGLDESNVAEKYYEPPLMQVIPSACAACPPNKYIVSNMCRGCVAHPCMQVCPKGAISMKDGKSFIDQEKCVKCGKCKAACPYDAISHNVRPCEQACGVKAIGSDEQGRASILDDKCVSCGMCMVSCPFGAISDKSQIFQLAHALRDGDKIVAIVAPAYIGQFGDDVTPGKFKTALQVLGFSDVHEVAFGADVGAISEAHHYAHEVATGNLPFLLTSCCPSWSMMAKKFFPTMIDNISQELTPMVATARKVKQDDPDAKVVFIGPCASKKLEAMRRTVRSDVDFVLTFEELDAMFDAREIEPASFEDEGSLHDATAAGRGYAVAGGVAGAIEACLKEYYPEVPVHIEHAESLAECKKMLALAKAGKLKGCMIEGMACPGGCMGGAGTNVPIAKSSKALKKFVAGSSKKLPAKELKEIKLS